MPALVAVLAAGLATRFGGGKLDAPCAGKSLGRWVLDSVDQAGLPAGIAIVGPQPPAFIAKAREWEQVTNPDPAAGLGSSLAIAARLAQARQRDLLVLLADMPLIPAGHLRALMETGSAAATRHRQGMAGVPAFFPHDDLARLTGLDGEKGAAGVLRKMVELAVLDIDQNALLDVDTAQDLADITQILSRRNAPPAG